MKIVNFFKMSAQPIEGSSEAHPVSDSGVNKKSVEGSTCIETQNETCISTTKPEQIEGGKIKVHNLIILDESGSMQSIYRPALSGVNETLQTIRGAHNEHKDQDHFVSLIAFDSGHYNRIYANTPAEDAKDITEEQYRPDGCTPLYDAMGRSINELRPKVTKGDVVLVTVITDGYENASREYNGKAIKSLVEAMKKEGWVFTYIGANQDVEAVAESMSIENCLAFEADDASTKAMFVKENKSRRRFFGRISNSNGKMFSVSNDYFDDIDD